MDICPKKAIIMVKDCEGFRYPRVNGQICIKCGRCEQVCPIKHDESFKNRNLYLGVQAKEDKIRYFSSSGGFFPVLAQYVMKRKGIVYGAGYDERMHVLHREIEEPGHLKNIKRTKYVQSNMEGIYRRIKRNLQENRWVLFSGTPCQADALMRFLNQGYENLIVVDLICYGVPSPGIWEDYVKYLERRHGGKMTDFSFRDKRNGDNGHMRSYIINGKEYADSLSRDIYCKMYFKNYILRPSCYRCRFCTVNRRSDFTIGDFWGIGRIRPDMDDGMGTSAVIIHSELGKEVWKEIKSELRWFACGEEEILQPRLSEPTMPNKGRRGFMMLYKIMPFRIMVKLLER